MSGRLAFLPALAAFAAAAPAQAVISRAGAWSADYLMLGVGARAAGMGEAFVAVAGDPSCLYWNAAGLTTTERFGLQLMHNTWLRGINHDYVAFTAPLEHFVKDMWGGAGISYSILHGEEEERTFETPGGAFDRQEGYFTFGDTVLTLGYGGQMTQTFAAGGGLKLVTQKIDNVNHLGVALDLGVTSKTAIPGFTAGVVLQNVGGKFARSFMPLTGKVGGAYELPGAPFSWTNLLVAADLWLGFLSGDNRPKINVGAEYKFLLGGAAAAHGGAGGGQPHELSLRAGYRWNHYWYSALDGVSVGAGLHFAISGGLYGVDYAIAPHEAFGVTHRMTLTGRF